MTIVVKKEFMIELNGIIGTIHTYTRNPFMMGYTHELKKAVECNDFDTIRIVLDRVIDWYTKEIDKIKSDEYVLNKSMHEKAYGILREYRQAL